MIGTALGGREGWDATTSAFASRRALDIGFTGQDLVAVEVVLLEGGFGGSNYFFLFLLFTSDGFWYDHHANAHFPFSIFIQAKNFTL